MSYEKKLREIGITLPEPPAPVAAYVPGVKVEKYIYTAGQIPVIDGELKYKGKVDKEVSVEDAYEAAKICVLNCLSIVKSLAGSLDNVEKIVKVVGFVNSSDDFIQQPKVINGASELLGQVFGDAGAHARSAVGVNQLPMNATCEVELVAKLK